MKQLVILSGKGGTGKTSLTAAFAHLASLDGSPFNPVLADADVDAANLELVLAPRIQEKDDFWGGAIAAIDPDHCSSCGNCAEVCRFDSIIADVGTFKIDPIACDGCAACVYQCPEDAIEMQNQIAGQWLRSESRFGTLFHAALRPAQENSGKLVTLVKQHARLLAMDTGQDMVLVDGPPGIGCPVISATSGADLALIVAEPTITGVHDMLRAIDTCRHFGVRALVCINKADLYPQGAAKIDEYCREEGITMIGRIPFDPTVTEAMVQGEPVTEFHPESPASQALRQIWAAVTDVLMEPSK
jgi:MinD superfamily P-loop ATPase